MALRSKTQRSLLFAFIGSIALCGLIGIYCLLVGRFGDLEGRILGSTAVVAAAAILALASAISWEQRRWHPVGLLGAIAAAVVLVLTLLIIWTRIDRRFGWFEESLGVAWVFATALPLLSLLSLARLNRGYRWVRRGTVAAIVLLAGLICWMILADPWNEDLWVRAMGILAICVTCGTIAVPILHRVSGIREHEAVQSFELMLQLTCPRCGLAQKLPVGRSKCRECGLKLRITIEEERCPTCGYSLYKLESGVCRNAARRSSSVRLMPRPDRLRRHLDASKNGS